MKSSRSVSCSAPLKGDAMAAVLSRGSRRRSRQKARNGKRFPPRCRKAPRAAHAHLSPPPGAWKAHAPCWLAQFRRGTCRLPCLLGRNGGSREHQNDVSLPQGSPAGQCAAPQSLTWEFAAAAASLYWVPQTLETPEGARPSWAPSLGGGVRNMRVTGTWAAADQAATGRGAAGLWRALARCWPGLRRRPLLLGGPHGEDSAPP